LFADYFHGDKNKTNFGRKKSIHIKLFDGKFIKDIGQTVFFFDLLLLLHYITKNRYEFQAT
jgi:hypothetical protein